MLAGVISPCPGPVTFPFGCPLTWKLSDELVGSGKFGTPWACMQCA